MLSVTERIRLAGMKDDWRTVKVVSGFLNLLRSGLTREEVIRIRSIRVNSAKRLHLLEFAESLYRQEAGVFL